MRKLIIFITLFLPITALAQLPAVKDTTLISPSTAYTGQWRWSLFNGDIIPQQYIGTKWYFMPTNKYLSKYYATLSGINQFTNTNTWAVGNTQGGYAASGFYSLYLNGVTNGYSLIQGNGTGGTNLTFLHRPDGNAPDVFNRLQFNNSSVNITTPNGHGLEYSSAKALFSPTDSSFVTKAWVTSRSSTDSATASNKYLLKTDTTALARKAAIASAYKAKSDSTASGGYQTIGNLFSRTDTRYYTKTALPGIVLSLPITGYTVGANTALADTDPLLTALGKLQGQITARPNQTLSLSGSAISISGGNSITPISTGISAAYSGDANSSTLYANSGFQPYVYSTATNYPSSSGTGFRVVRSAGSAAGVLEFAVSSTTTPTVWVRKGISATTYTAWTDIASAPTPLRLTGSGTGAATTISIPHGLTGVTSASIVTVTPINSASSGTFYVTTDATNLNIIYSVAPVTGTNNLSYNVVIKP